MRAPSCMGGSCVWTKRCIICVVPTEFTRIPFPVKALKILLRELQSGGEAASRRMNASEAGSDDGVGILLVLSSTDSWLMNA